MKNDTNRPYRDKPYFRWGITALVVIIISILLVVIFTDIPGFFSMLNGFGAILSPLIYGVVFAILLDQLVTENGAQIVKAHGLAGAGVHERRGFIFHVCANIIPILGHLRLRQIDLVRNVFGFHSCFSFRVLAFSGKRETKKTFIHRENRLSV